MPEKWGGAFFVLLVAQGAALLGVHAWRAFVIAQDGHIVDTVLVEVLVATPMFVLAGILSMIELEAALTLSVWYESRVRRKEAEMRAKLEREDAEMRANIREEVREEIWEVALAEGMRLERERAKRLTSARERPTAARERAKRYPY